MKNSAAALKEEMKDADFINGDEGGGDIAEEKKQFRLLGAKPVNSGDTSMPSASPSQTNPAIDYEGVQLESTKEAMCEVREENERLKTILAQILSDYQSLQMRIFEIIKRGQAKKNPAESEPSSLPVHNNEHELLSLCLGSGSSFMIKQEEKTSCNGKETNDKEDNQTKEGLTLGMECKMDEQENDAKNEVQLSDSSESSSEGTATKEETAIGNRRWPPCKAMKTLKPEEDEVSPQAQIKRARVSVRARCDAHTMNDGCQWRKYGQKISKGNPCPRAYYRCTVAPGCPVRKQVQRCAEDMSILISTYEGNHNHPLPISATPMASTTAAAASMLISASSSSLPVTAPHHITTGLNISFPDISHNNGQLYFSNPSISPSLSQPTITLDLTNPPASTAYQHNGFSSTSPRSFYSQTSFNFLPSESSSSWISSGGYLNHGAHQPYYKSLYMGALRQSQDSYARKEVPNAITDSIAKAMTSDPSFQSALAAAITSYMGASLAGAICEGSCGALNAGEQIPSLATAMKPIGNSGYLAGLPSTNMIKHQGNKHQGNMMFYPESLGSSSKCGTDGTTRDDS